MLKTLPVALIVAFTSVVLINPPIQAASDIWSTDFEKSKQVAAADQSRELLVEFTGSDWCPPCIALQKNVLSKDAFKEKMPRHFVMVKLDNPRDKSGQTEAEQKQYRELSRRYGVQGVPTVMLIDDEGKPYAQWSGYGGQEADAWIKKVIDARSIRGKRDAALARAAKAEGEARAKHLAAALEPMDAKLVASAYRDTVDQIIELDSDNELGLKKRYQDLLKIDMVEAELRKLMGKHRKDPAGMAEAIDGLIERHDLGHEPLQMALMYKSFTQFATDQAAAKATLEKALAAAPDSQLADRIRQIMAEAFE